MATIMSGIGFQEMSFPQMLQNQSSSPSSQRKISRSETIHSGHFMVSEIDESEQTVERDNTEVNHESDYERPVETNETLIDYDLETKCKETTQTYVYGPQESNVVSIDGSLTKLFECMSLAYSGKITSPRWKQFKGLKLRLKDKIRLNNIIWRAWHIQYIAGRNPIVCQFSSPVDSDRHKKAEAVIMEGKYWKRRLASVTAEYKKWRLFHRKIGRPQTPSRPTSFNWEDWTTTFNTTGDGNSDDYLMDFMDYSLFSQFLSPNLIDFPNPREIARSGMGAEFMQPGLGQLQPNLDDFMDTFEPLQEFFLTSKNMSSLPTLPEETSIDTAGSNMMVQNNSKINQTMPSTPDMLNSLLCQTSTSNSSQIQNYSTENKNLVDSIVQNQSQMSPELQMSFKNNTIQSMQPIIPNQTQASVQGMTVISQSSDQPMRGIEDIDSIQSKPMQNSLYTPFVSPLIGAQSSVPLSQSQSSVNTVIQNESRSQIATDFAQTDQSSYPTLGVCSVPQQYTIKSSYGKKYINQNQMNVTPFSTATDSKFAVPKSLPIKQRHRERSISTPHINKENSSQLQQITPMPAPVSAMSLTDIRATQSAMERSSSLPVYTQERRRGVTSMPRSAMSGGISGSTANVSYQSHQVQPQMQPKLQLMANKSMSIDNSMPSAYSPQMVVSNAYDTSQGSSSGSNLIARLLTSNSLNNISNESSQQIYSNQSTAHNISLANSVTANRPSTIDASSIGIRNLTTSSSNDRIPLMFGSKYMDTSVAMSGQVTSNVKQNYIMQSNPTVCSSATSLNTMSKSRSSPVALSSPKDSFSATPSPPPSRSPVKTQKTKGTKDRVQYKEHRRVCHINAEQKRRCNIKNGFDTLRSLLPSISQNTNTKISKAAMLQRAAEHISSLKNERQSQQEEYDRLKQQVESLNQTIGVFQNQLPATGVPVSCQRSNQTRELYENYVRERTLQNWKFWIFSIIMESLWDSYNNTVSTTTDLEMTKTLLRWLEQTCSLINLRRGVLNSLRYLSTSTNILTDPKNLPEEAVLAVTKKEKQLSSLSS